MVWENSHLFKIADSTKHLVTHLLKFQTKNGGRKYMAVFFWETYSLEFLIINNFKKLGIVYSEIRNEKELKNVSKYWYTKLGLYPIFDKRTKKLFLYQPLEEFRYKRRNYGAYREVLLDDSKVKISDSITFFRIVHHKKSTGTVSVYEIKDNTEIWDLIFHYLDLKE